MGSNRHTVIMYSVFVLLWRDKGLSGYIGRFICNFVKTLADSHKNLLRCYGLLYMYMEVSEYLLNF